MRKSFNLKNLIDVYNTLSFEESKFIPLFYVLDASVLEVLLKNEICSNKASQEIILINSYLNHKLEFKILEIPYKLKDFIFDVTLYKV